VLSASFSQKGDYVAVAGDLGGRVIICDAATAEELKKLGEYSDTEFFDAAFSPDGRHIATTGEAGGVTIFDYASGTPVRHLQAPVKIALRLTFSPDGELIATAGADGFVRIWNAATAREIDGSPLKHKGVVGGVAFSPDGQSLASGGWDRTVRIWNTSSWKQSQLVVEADAATHSPAFSPDNEWLAWGASDSTVKLLYRSTGELHTRGHLGVVWSVAFSPDGKFLASASEDGTTKIWKVPSSDATSRSAVEDKP
jgi:WD40 repeat protein